MPEGMWAECPVHLRRSYTCLGVNSAGVLFQCLGDSFIPDSSHMFIASPKRTAKESKKRRKESARDRII